MAKFDSDGLRPSVEDAMDVHALLVEPDHFTAVRRRSFLVILYVELNRIHWEQ